MTWINTLFILVLFNSFIGSLAFFCWKKAAKKLEEQAGYLQIYTLLKKTVWFFLFPGGILAACNSNLRYFIRRPVIEAGWEPGAWLRIVIFVMALVWICGVARIGIRRSIHYYRFRKICKYNREMGIPELKEYFKDICDRQNYYCTVWAYENEIIQVPMIFGIRKKYILFPKSTYTSQEIRIILEHELVHVKHHDLLMKRLVLFLCTFLWFIPGPSEMLEALDDWCETGCDILLCASSCSIWSRREYFEPIVYRACSQTVIGPGVALTLTGDMISIKSRMLRIKRYTSGPPSGQIQKEIYVLMIIAFLLIGSLLSFMGSWSYGAVLLSKETVGVVRKGISHYSCRTAAIPRWGSKNAGWVYLPAGKTGVFYLYLHMPAHGEDEDGILKFTLKSRDDHIIDLAPAGSGNEYFVQYNPPAGGWYCVQLEYIGDKPLGVTIIRDKR